MKSTCEQHWTSLKTADRELSCFILQIILQNESQKDIEPEFWTHFYENQTTLREICFLAATQFHGQSLQTLSSTAAQIYKTNHCLSACASSCFLRHR